MQTTKTIAEMTTGIVLANFQRNVKKESAYQSEAELESYMIQQLIMQGYERLTINSSKELAINVKIQIEKLNKISFSPSEWERFIKEYLNPANEGLIEKTRKIQENYIYDFTFDDGHLKNIKIIDKQNIHNNFLQVVNQVSQEGAYQNRYDVTILINGLPLVHIELKKRGTNLQEAFNQIRRYSKESFNTEYSLYKYVQIFVISNGTYTKYFANTTARNKNNYEFACEWADAKNHPIHDLEDFTKTFFEKRVILEILTKYCVFDKDNILLIMRPYQIAATERILWKIKSSYEAKKAGRIEAGGFIWHTTGSGKTLTSFKTARLAGELKFINKVFFIVDRKDLDVQTVREYRKFQPDSVNGTKDTKELQKIIEDDTSERRIIVTTIQKLHEFIKKNPKHDIYEKHCVLIFDECHRSQFGEAQKNIRKSFKKYYQFGFTGTPIFLENSLSGETTPGLFGAQLHAYIITDAIRDQKVLKFKVDYKSVNPQFKEAESTQDEQELKLLEKKAFNHPNRISAITKHILEVFNDKTRRNERYTLKERKLNGFNAMFAVQSIEMARLYYEELKNQQKDLPEEERLKIATIFSYAQNEEQSAIGEIVDENFEAFNMNTSAKEFLETAIADYNSYFNSNFSLQNFQEYYGDLAKQVREKHIDLLIVVGMFLTGFDAPTLNTLFVDKNLRYHGLIQAFSRTNRILNKVKAFGNIVCFRDLEQATKDAIKTFGEENSINIILEKSYDEYMNGFKDEVSGKSTKGYQELCKEIKQRFPEPTEIVLEKDKKEFVKLFGEVLKAENILKNFDEFEPFKLISEREMQDMKSVYVDIREEVFNAKSAEKTNKIQIDYSDIEFQIELLKTDEINLDYILALLFEKTRDNKNMDSLKDEIKRTIRSNIGIRAKEQLITSFLDTLVIANLTNHDDFIESFFTFARQKKEEAIMQLIKNEDLKGQAISFIHKSCNDNHVEVSGLELDGILPPTSRRAGARERKKETVLRKIRELTEIFGGI